MKAQGKQTNAVEYGTPHAGQLTARVVTARNGCAISQNAAIAEQSGEHGWAPFEMEVIHVENVRMPAAGYRQHLRGVFCEVLASENVCMKQQLEAKKLSGNDPVIASESGGRCPAKQICSRNPVGGPQTFLPRFRFIS